MLSNIFYKKIVQGILIVFGLFFLAHTSFAQEILDEPLYIESVVEFEVYPYMNQSNPGLCVVAGVNASDSTLLTFRRNPMEGTSPSANWTMYLNSSPVSPGTTSYSNLASSVGFQPGTKYIIQLIEKTSDATYHKITPDDGNDDLETMCTPNMDGTPSANCPDAPFVVTDCSQTGINQAIQSFNEDVEGSVLIQTITPTQNSVVLGVNTQYVEPSELITLYYTTNLNDITNSNFSNISSETFYAAQDLVSVEILGLQQNTTYYMTITDSSGNVIINTDSNQAYETFSTGSGGNSGTGNQSSSSGGGTPATINVNLTGQFGQAELAGENINQGFTQCGYGETYDCDFNQVLATIDRVIKFVLYIIVLPVSAILFAWSGIKLIVARAKGKSGALSEAKAMFGKVLLGLVFALGAWVIVKFVLVIFGYSDASGLLSQILGITT